MANSRGQIQGVVLVEDRRTERFIRHLLEHLGFDLRGKRIRFVVAPSGEGSGEAFVKRAYPAEVKYLRSRHPLCFLLAIRDGDGDGVRARKAQLDEVLKESGLAARGEKERIGTPVPTWSIETWLLDLLGEVGLNEDLKPTPGDGPNWKDVFERTYADR